MVYYRPISFLLVLFGLYACSTPYSPPVHVKGAEDFPGLIERLDKTRTLDVVLVHGMCTHKTHWAYQSMNELLLALDPSAPRIVQPPPDPNAENIPKIQVHQHEATISGNKLRMTALVWSPLTTQLKAQLNYDMTGNATDCTAANKCKPMRALANGKVKDWLLNDCLADAIIYEGRSRRAIRQELVDALTAVLEAAPPDSELILLSDSLGSKMTFDALSQMLSAPTSAKAESAATRLALVFMKANQMPILGLADQEIRVATDTKAKSETAQDGLPSSGDPLQRYLQLREQKQQLFAAPGVGQPFDKLKLVAFTDPNDLLSYRLMPSRYNQPNVAIVDVVVSNAKTYFGLIERPDQAHLGYDSNADVTSLIACGKPKSRKCK